LLCLLIAIAVSIYLADPVFSICLGLTGTASAVMTMPEATMHEDHLAPAGKDQIRRTGQILSV